MRFHLLIELRLHLFLKVGQPSQTELITLPFLVGSGLRIGHASFGRRLLPVELVVADDDECDWHDVIDRVAILLFGVCFSRGGNRLLGLLCES